ncbi:hypothetical protein CRG98_031560 [Punica granatum]|uniref:Reverse transcriptase zinc-binding domain-containing protein n=1 Tax=Punica granatum TaxID=22663 RepID=A0A2I0IWB7_PUNGR|nr:hypothetical protein CRG98_031560 [Punica granatum]
MANALPQGHGASVERGEKWRVGDGARVKFWEDKWVGSSTLRRQVVGPLPRGEAERLVSSAVSPERDWSLDDGKFSAKSAHGLLAKADNTDTPIDCRWIWKCKATPRILLFVWLCLHQRIATTSLFVQRGIQIDPCCPFCRGHNELVLHILRDGCIAKLFWEYITPPGDATIFFIDNIDSWLTSNCTSLSTSHLGIPWDIIFITAI